MLRPLCCLLIFSLSMLISGCWDAREIQNLDYPVAIGIDMITKEDGRIRHIYTYSLPMLEEQAPEKRELHSIESSNLEESLSLLQSQVSKEVTLGQLKAIILDEAVVRVGVRPHLRFFHRSPQIRGNTLVFISDGQSARDLLNKEIVGESGMGNYLEDLTRFINKYNFIPFMSLDDFYVEAFSINPNTVLPMVKISGQQIYLSGLAVIKKGKMVEKLDKRDSELVTILRNERATGVIYQGPLHKTDSALVTAKTQVIPFYKNGQFSFLLKVEMTGDLAESPENTSELISDPKLLAKIENRLARKVERDLEQVVRKLQKDLKTDVIFLGQAAYLKYPNKFSTQRWEQEFPKADIKIKVKVKIRKIGIST